MGPLPFSRPLLCSCLADKQVVFQRGYFFPSTSKGKAMRFTCPFTVCLVVLLLPHGVQAGGPKVPIKPWKEIFILKALPAPAGDDKLRHLLVARYNEIAGEMKSVITLKYLAEPHPWYDEAMVDVSRRLFRAAQCSSVPS